MTDQTNRVYVCFWHARTRIADMFLDTDTYLQARDEIMLACRHDGTDGPSKPYTVLRVTRQYRQDASGDGRLIVRVDVFPLPTPTSEADV
jgi:hypothetical protein